MKDDAEAILCELLVLRCRRGDPSGWREVIGLFERRLCYYLWRLVGDAERDAWDVLQQTWLEAFKNLHRLAEPRALRTWLYRIAHCQAVSHGRRAGRELPVAAHDDGAPDVEDVPAAAADDADAFTAADTAEQVHAGLSRLSLPHREVLTLHFLEDLPVEEIATVLGVPPGTVKSRLFSRSAPSARCCWKGARHDEHAIKPKHFARAPARTRNRNPRPPGGI